MYIFKITVLINRVLGSFNMNVAHKSVIMFANICVFTKSKGHIAKGLGKKLICSIPCIEYQLDKTSVWDTFEGHQKGCIHFKKEKLICWSTYAKPTMWLCRKIPELLSPVYDTIKDVFWRHGRSAVPIPRWIAMTLIYYQKPICILLINNIITSMRINMISLLQWPPLMKMLECQNDVHVWLVL